MARLLAVVAAFMGELAQAPALPFSPAIPPEQAREVEAFWIDLFGGWGREA
jgi:hypothetical protein